MLWPIGNLVSTQMCFVENFGRGPKPLRQQFRGVFGAQAKLYQLFQFFQQFRRDFFGRICLAVIRCPVLPFHHNHYFSTYFWAIFECFENFSQRAAQGLFVGFRQFPHEGGATVFAENPGHRFQGVEDATRGFEKHLGLG